jgi:glucose-1-phosphate adenylyltransferase
MDHVGSGKDWDLARKDGGLIMLPPFGDMESEGLYTSRLEALKGATSFLFRADEEYVVMTDCDNVCRIDYRDVIDEHIKNRADITLVYKKIKKEDLIDREVTDLSIEDGRVKGVKFKPVDMADELNVFINVYVMKKSLLQNIVMDSISHNRRHFLTDIIASCLDSMKIYGYEHKGFYAGITSLQAYYDSNMKMLDTDIRHEVFGDRSVFTKIRDSAPTKYGKSALVKNSMIADGCIIEGEVENSIIFRNVKVARGAVIKNSIVMQNTVLGENCSLNCIIADKNVVIRDRKVLSGSENHPFYIGKGIMI